MHSFHDLLLKYPSKPGSIAPGNDRVNASMTANPGSSLSLKLSVESLLKQVDTLHIFLNNFSEIPVFLDHEKIYLTRSQDFGNLGECGKYYWTDDLGGYHFICSDRLIYPEDYVELMKAAIEKYDRKAVIGAGGYQFSEPFIAFTESTVYFSETSDVAGDVPVAALKDLALAYHSSTLRNSRHFYYQPELSDFWFSIVCLGQNVPLICSQHNAGWLTYSGPACADPLWDQDTIKYRDFLIKSYFQPADHADQTPPPTDINAFFEKIYVMNLDRRPDRWDKICRIAKKYDLKVSRFPAVDGYKEPHKSAWEKYAATGLQTLPEGIEPLADHRDKFKKYFHYIARIQYIESRLGRKAMQSPGARGYAMSYISILKEAIQCNYRRILIFDDDIVLHKNFREEFTRHISHLPHDWKLIMLGVMQHHWEPHITPCGDMFYHSNGSSVASHAVGIDRKVFLPLLFYAEKLDLPIDEGAIFHIQNIYPKQSLVFVPNLVIQDMSGSDINSSEMKKEETDKWITRFRWKIEDYDFDY
ncbi:MAG: glycosyltransferase family 25 protein [Bacteroidales bacterium]|nr:glycosyltransferase family 25 protein [Bacteroidales bacterium]